MPKLSTTIRGHYAGLATLALAGIGPAAEDAIPALRTLLENPDEDMRNWRNK